jgi:hypothetical protein
MKTPGCNYNKEGGGAVLQNPPGDRARAIQAVRAQAAIALSRVRCGPLIEKPQVAHLEIAAFHFPFGMPLLNLQQRTLDFRLENRREAGMHS